MDHKGPKMLNLWSSAFSAEDLKHHGIDLKKVDIIVLTKLVSNKGYTPQNYQMLLKDFINTYKSAIGFLSEKEAQLYNNVDVINDSSAYANFLKAFKKVSKKTIEGQITLNEVLYHYNNIMSIKEDIKSMIDDLSKSKTEKILSKVSDTQDVAVTFSVLKDSFTIVQQNEYIEGLSKMIAPYVTLIRSHELKIRESSESHSVSHTWEKEKIKFFILPKEKNEKGYKVVEELKSLAAKKYNEELHKQFVDALRFICDPIFTYECKSKIGLEIISSYLNIVCGRIFNYSPTLKNGLISFDQSIKQFKTNMSRLIPSLEKDSDLLCAVKVCLSIFRGVRVSKENYLFNNLQKIVNNSPLAKKCLFEASLSESIKKRLVRFKSLYGYQKLLVKDEQLFLNLSSLVSEEQKKFKQIDAMIKKHDINAYFVLQEFNKNHKKVIKFSTLDKYLNSRKKSYTIIKDKIKLNSVERSKISGQPTMEHLEEKVQDSKEFEMVIDPLPFQLALKGLWYDSKTPYQTSEFLTTKESKRSKGKQVITYEVNDNFKNLVMKYACKLHKVNSSNSSEEGLENEESSSIYKNETDILNALEKAIADSNIILRRRLIRLGYDKILLGDE